MSKKLSGFGSGSYHAVSFYEFDVTESQLTDERKKNLRQQQQRSRSPHLWRRASTGRMVKQSVRTVAYMVETEGR